MSKYLYKHIEVFQSWGTWHADYIRPNGTRFALHRCCCDTKAKAYKEAKEQVDFLNLLNGYAVAVA